ncbi:MAG: TIGR03936 family radical SAM-associated protein [Candidatus Brocadiales bacterium]
MEDFIRLIQKVRIRFKKQGSLRFISHHDLMKLFERVIRRAEIPIHMSEGFNPRPKISFPMALAVGVEGLDEVVELGLNEWVRPSTLIDQLKHQLPQGIEIRTAEPVSPGENAQVEEVTCGIRLPAHLDCDAGRDGKTLTQAKIEELLQRKEIFVCRKKDGIVKKSFNIRPSIIDIVAGTNFIELRLRATSEGMARPEEVISALGLDSEIDCRLLEITRTKVKLGDR